MTQILATLLLAALAVQPAPRAKNVILLVADGFGTAHVAVAQHARGAELRMGTMPFVGLSNTSCADRHVTDSAAGATALATGVKTNYEMVSIDPSTGAPLPTILELAERQGKATGLVTTAAFWDATPAAFAAHAKHRHDADIAEQMMLSGADVIAGSGLQALGKNGRLPLAELAAKGGYEVITTRAQLDAAGGDAKMLAVFPSQERDADVPEAPLPVLAKWAIERLASDPDGFFLLIEHEGTDSASHQNFTPGVRAGMVSFDEAVGVALDFAAGRNDTLVVVTGDHETGGLRITETRQKARFRMEWSTTDHTAAPVPVFAYGPGAAAFGVLQDNTEVGKKLLAALLQSP